jgi:hypothetical protein
MEEERVVEREEGREGVNGERESKVREGEWWLEDFYLRDKENIREG